MRALVADRADHCAGDAVHDVGLVAEFPDFLDNRVFILGGDIVFEYDYHFYFCSLRRRKWAWDKKSRRLGCLRLGKFCFSSSTNPQDTQTALAGKPIPAAKKSKKLRTSKTHGGGS